MVSYYQYKRPVNPHRESSRADTRPEFDSQSILPRSWSRLSAICTKPLDISHITLDKAGLLTKGILIVDWNVKVDCVWQVKVGRCLQVASRPKYVGSAEGQEDYVFQEVW